MLHIILTILKVIGIILLCILGLLILILSCILFVPVRYRAAVSQKEDTNAVLRVHWLLHIISVKAVLREKKLRWKLKVFGIPIRDSNRKAKPKKPRKPHKKKKKQEQELLAEQESVSATTQNQPDGNTVRCEAESAGRREAESVRSEAESTDGFHGNDRPDETDAQDSADTSGRKGGTRDTFFRKIPGIIQKIQYTIRNIYDKIKQICCNIRHYLDILERKETAEAWKQCTWAVKHLIHHIRPRKLSGHVLFGMEDPATTGKILSYVCLLFPLYGDHLEVQADFEQKILEADVRMRGRIRVFTVLRIALRVYRDRNVRRVLHWLGK